MIVAAHSFVMPFLLPRAYRPAHADNRMRSEGDVAAARADYATRRSANLRLLMRSRFDWMAEYIAADAVGVDIGCGAGFSREFVRCRKLWLTDVAPHAHLDVGGVDALHLPFADASFDFVIATCVVHHLPHPVAFFREARRVLRPGGHLLMHEAQASLLFCGVLRTMRHEGYSFDVDVFDETCICTDPTDLWAGNNAIPRLLFDDHAAFQRHDSNWQIVRDEPCECLMFLNSGGVTAKTSYLPLPVPVLRSLQLVDRALSRLAPQVFSLGRRIALRAL